MGDGVILVLGYREFSRYYWNPAEEIVNTLRDTRVAGYRVIGHSLPVSFKTVRELVPRLLGETDPDAVLGLGLAPSATKPVVELVAINTAFFETPDADGYRARMEPVQDGSEYVTVLSPELARHVYRRCTEEEGYSLRLGVSVGTYLCNTLAYMIYSWGARVGRPAVFMHIPPTTSLSMRLGSGGGLAFWELVETVKCVISVMAELAR